MKFTERNLARSKNVLKLCSIFVLDAAPLFEEVADAIAEVDTMLRMLGDVFKLILCQ